MNPIERAFIESWIQMRDYYNDPYTMRMFLGHALADRLLHLIDAMRQSGYDAHLRAKQSAQHFILSRSYTPDLYGDHPYLCFVFEYWEQSVHHQNTRYESLTVRYHKGDTCIHTVEQDGIGLTEEIRHLLHQLLDQPILE